MRILRVGHFGNQCICNHCFLVRLAVEDGTSEKLFKQGICLPSGSSMCDEDVYRVCDLIKKVM